MKIADWVPLYQKLFDSIWYDALHQ